MEFYTYVNIFETKGLEYLLLMAFFALFIFLVRYLSGRRARNSEPEEQSRPTAGQRAATLAAASRKSR